MPWYVRLRFFHRSGPDDIRWTTDQALCSSVPVAGGVSLSVASSGGSPISSNPVALNSLSLSEPPRLNNLPNTRVDSLSRIAVHYRVFNSLLSYFRIPQKFVKLGSFFQVNPHFSKRPSGGWYMQPPNTSICQPRTRWVGNHQIPAIVNYVAYIALVMWPRCFSWQQITAHGIVTGSNEGVSNTTTVFASNKNSHISSIILLVSHLVPR